MSYPLTPQQRDAERAAHVVAEARHEAAAQARAEFDYVADAVGYALSRGAITSDTAAVWLTLPRTEAGWLLLTGGLS